MSSHLKTNKVGIYTRIGRNNKEELMKEVQENIAMYEISRTRRTIKMQRMFDFEIEKANSEEMKECLKNLKEDFLIEFE